MSHATYEAECVVAPGQPLASDLQRILVDPATAVVRCSHLLDAEVRTAVVLDQLGVEIEVTVATEPQTLVTVQCPFGAGMDDVDIEWDYRSALAHPDKEQVGHWTCPLCGEVNEVTR